MSRHTPSLCLCKKKAQDSGVDLQLPACISSHPHVCKDCCLQHDGASHGQMLEAVSLEAVQPVEEGFRRESRRGSASSPVQVSYLLQRILQLSAVLPMRAGHLYANITQVACMAVCLIG
jgi:hypothetical protein